MTKITSLYQKPFPRATFFGTVAIVVGNLSVFLLTEIDRESLGVLSLNAVSVVAEGAWWQVFTYMYVHESVNHIAFNMIFLLLAGLKVEETMGSWEFLAYYHVCGALAGLLSLGVYWGTGQTSAFLLGSSGAVFAVIFAYAVYRFDGRTLFVPLAIFIVFDGIQSLASLVMGGFSFSWEGVLYIGLFAGVVTMIFKSEWNKKAANIVLLFTSFDLLSQLFNPYGGVAHLTHLAGFLFAFLYLTLRMRLPAWKMFWA